MFGRDPFSDPTADNALARMKLTAWQTTEGACRRGRALHPYAQIIDLAPDGYITAHRDNMETYGEFTCGLNLESSAIVRFRPINDFGEDYRLNADGSQRDPVVDVLLRPRTLYVMHDAMRWEYTHEVLSKEESQQVWAQQGESQPEETRTRRLSVIVRDMGAPHLRSNSIGFFGGVW